METQRSRLPIAAADVWAPKSDSTLISPQFQILFGGFHFFKIFKKSFLLLQFGSFNLNPQPLT